MAQLEQAKYRWEELKKWEERYFSYEGTEANKSFAKWNEQLINRLGEKRKQKILSTLEICVIHLQSWLEQSKTNEETKRQIIQHARVFHSAVRSIEDLKQLPLEQLDYIAEQIMVKQRLLAFGQGGLTGMGGAFLLAADLPIIALIQLRSLQHLAYVYGYDVRKPNEMMNMLKLFNVATIPKASQAKEWDKLIVDTVEQESELVFYQGDDSFLQSDSLEQLTKQIAKSFVIMMLRKKVIQGIPVFGIAVGAGVNYRFTRQVIEVGQRYYQKRRLLEQLQAQ